MEDPTISRARTEISSDQALIRKLMVEVVDSGHPANSQTRARIAALERLIAANKTLLGRLND